MPVIRLPGNAGPGLAFVTTTVIEWLPVFSRSEIARVIASQLAETACIKSCSITGYVVMPSHVHMLVGLANMRCLSSFVQSFKSLSSRRVRKLINEEYADLLYRSGRFHLWMRRLDDVVITSDTHFRTKLDYIHSNPVKADIATDAVSWQYSSARCWLLNEPGIVPIDKNFRWIPEG